MILSSIPDSGNNGNTPQEIHPDDLDWKTISEIARLLGVDQKQVRRYAARLNEEDRTCPGHVPQRLRLSAVLLLRQRGMAGRQSIEKPDMSRTRQGHVREQTTLSLEQAIVLVRQSYERILDEQHTTHAALMAEKEARIKELQVALEFAIEAARTTSRALPSAEQTSTPEEITSRRPWWAWWKRRKETG